MKKNIVWFAVIALGFLLAAGWFARPDGAGSPPETADISASLKDLEGKFDFGKVSMARGKVSHIFRIKNEGTGSAKIKSMFTSCMCTVATLEVNGRKYGPYGMPGHGYNAPLNIPIEPGAEAAIEAVFDPAAHGPAGVGLIERSIILEGADGDLELQFSAEVTP